MFQSSSFNTFGFQSLLIRNILVLFSLFSISIYLPFCLCSVLFFLSFYLRVLLSSYFSISIIIYLGPFHFIAFLIFFILVAMFCSSLAAFLYICLSIFVFFVSFCSLSLHYIYIILSSFGFQLDIFVIFWLTCCIII